MAQPSAMYTQLHGPTGVTHCVSAFLTHPAGAAIASPPNLVVVRSTALDVYAIRLVGVEQKLSLRGRSTLFGVVESLAVLPGGPGQRDALLVTFREAKLSVLYWDEEAAELAPSSLHYFEGDPALRAGRTVFPTPPLALTDPEGRCAAVVLYRHQLAVLPAVREDDSAGISYLGFPTGTPAGPKALFGAGAGSSGDLRTGGPGLREDGGGLLGPAAGGSAAATLGNSYVDNLAKAGIKEVRDAAFLHGYSEPVLLVLHEEDPTWAGSLRTKKDTCCLTALSLNLSMKRHPRIWAAQGLPFDARRIIPVAFGGAVVLCTHLILYYAQGHEAGVVVNSVALGTHPAPPPLDFNNYEAPSVTAAKYAQQYGSTTHPDTVASAVEWCDKESAVGLGLELDGAHGTWLESSGSAWSPAVTVAGAGAGGISVAPSGPGGASGAGDVQSMHSMRSSPGSAGNTPVLLLGLRTGQLVLVRLVREGGGLVSRLVVAKSSASPPCSCISALGPGLFFLGSTQGDSLLVRATPLTQQPPPPPQQQQQQQQQPVAANGVPPGDPAPVGAASDEPPAEMAGAAETKAGATAAVPAVPAEGEDEGSQHHGTSATGAAAEPAPGAGDDAGAAGAAAREEEGAAAADGSAVVAPSPKRRRLDSGAQVAQHDLAGAGASSAAPAGETPLVTTAADAAEATGAADADPSAPPLAATPTDIVPDQTVATGGAMEVDPAAAPPSSAPEEEPAPVVMSQPGLAAAAGADGDGAAPADGVIDDYRGSDEGEGEEMEEGGGQFDEQDDHEEEEQEGEEEEEEEEEPNELKAEHSMDEEALIYGEAIDSHPAGGEASGPSTAGAAGTAQPSAASLRYGLKIVDSLVHIGPIRDMSLGGLGSPSFPPFVVACCGRERGGALCMLRQHVFPEVITDVPLQGVLGVWALHHKEGSDIAETPHDGAGGAAAPTPGEAEEGPPYHSYLLISFPGSTKVLSTADELQEVTDSVEFAADTATIAAGSVCGGRRMVQAFAQGVRIMAGTEAQQDFWAAELSLASASGGSQQQQEQELGPTGSAAADVAIASACILDPYILVRLTNGTAVLLEVDASSGNVSLAPHGRDILGSSKGSSSGGGASRIEACCLYQDTINALALPCQEPQHGQQQQQRQHGDAVGSPAGGDHGRQRDGSGDVGQFFCAVCRSDGRLEIWCLPGWECVFQCRNAGEGPSVLQHGGTSPTDSPDGVSPSHIAELRLECFGDAPTAGAAGAGAAGAAGAGPPQLVLAALTVENTLLIYQAFLGPRGSIRFRRLHLDLPPTLPPAAAALPLGSGAAVPAAAPRLVRFDRLGEALAPGEVPCWGLFVAGQSPHLLVAARGTLYAHPLFLPAGLGAAGFTPFHNINCPYGFITACVGDGGRGSLQICQPPARTRLDCPWPRTKILLKATPLRVAHYPEADLFAVLASRQVPYRPFLPEEEGGEPHASYAYALADATAKARGTMEGHEVRLIDPGTWSTAWRYSLLPGERALAVKAVHLRDTATGSTVPLLAVGAAFTAGEDYPVLGRVLLFRVHRGPAEGAAPAEAPGQHEWSATLVYSRDFRGPVSALACLEGYLLLSAGNRIETLALSTAQRAQQPAPDTGEALLPGEQPVAYKFNRTAFYDGPMLVTSLKVVKNFVALGDAQHSVQFVRYTDENRQLLLLGKDFSKADITTTEFLISGTSLHMVCGDGSGVLRLLSYAPSHPGSWRGQKLVPWGAFQLGDAPLSMLRIQLKPASATDKGTRQAVLLGDLAGGIGVVAPLVRAEALPVLQGVQRELLRTLRHAAGLNPASFRMQHSKLTPSAHGAKWFGAPLKDPGVLDGDLLLQFFHLPRSQQSQVSKAAGSSREPVLAILGDIFTTSVVF